MHERPWFPYLEMYKPVNSWEFASPQDVRALLIEIHDDDPQCLNNYENFRILIAGKTSDKHTSKQ